MYNEGKVSIIVPVYNAENFLSRTVDSILAQTYENWELLLADDCSTDQSRDIMKSYTDERIHCFYCEKNSGPAGARNLALRHASGQYVAFLDADDFWLPQKLEKQISFMKKGNYPFSKCRPQRNGRTCTGKSRLQRDFKKLNDRTEHSSVRP